LCLISQVWLNNRLSIKYTVYEVPTMINELMSLVLVVYSRLCLTQASVDLDANVL